MCEHAQEATSCVAFLVWMASERGSCPWALSGAEKGSDISTSSSWAGTIAGAANIIIKVGSMSVFSSFISRSGKYIYFYFLFTHHIFSHLSKML